MRMRKSSTTAQRVPASGMLNQQGLGVLTAIIAVFLTALVGYFLYRKKFPTRKYVLIVGISGSGKTSLFCRLCYADYKTTCTSVAENTGQYLTRDGRQLMVDIVDIPGHPRLRGRNFDNYKHRARAVLFIIQTSSSFEDELAELSGYLYDVLSDAVLRRRRVPVYVVFNSLASPSPEKAVTDDSDGQPWQEIEKELLKIQQSRERELLATVAPAAGGGKRYTPGEVGAASPSTRAHGLAVTAFLECNSGSRTGDVSKVQALLDKLG